MRRKSTYWSVLIGFVILIIGGVLTAIRWQAWFGNPPEPHWQGDTIHYHFHTFGQKEVPGFVYQDARWQDTISPDTLSFLLFGDIHNSLTHSEIDSISARIPRPDGIIQTGDLVERGYFYYFQQIAHELKGTLLDTIPIINCAGNHEYLKGLRRTLSPLWFDAFKHPHNGPIDFIGRTYYVDFDGLRCIVLDTNGLRALHHFTRVNAWLNKTIDGAEDRFVVVVMHHPVFACGAGRFNPLVYAFLRVPLQRADLVFAGHDHNYSRRMPFVNTNAATKGYLHRLSTHDERVCSGHRLYQTITIVDDTLTMKAFLLETGEEYDHIRIVRNDSLSAGERQIEDLGISRPEMIDLPERYQGKDNRKIQRFLERRAKRLSCPYAY